MNRDEWVALGIANGWCKPFCYVHDAPPLTDEETLIRDEEDGNLDAICIAVVRV